MKTFIACAETQQQQQQNKQENMQKKTKKNKQTREYASWPLCMQLIISKSTISVKKRRKKKEEKAKDILHGYKDWQLTRH